MPEQDLQKWGIAFVDKVNSAIDNTMEQIAEEGQEMLVGFIETRGTANPKYGGKTAWKRTYYKRGGGPKSGPSQGRVWSGEMRADIEQRTSRPQKWIAMASFGWIDHYQEYYGLQEQGFNHPQTGEHIAGMFIFADANDLIMKRAADILDKELYRV